MCAERARGFETARKLVFTPCAGLEQGKPTLDALLNAPIETHVEVDEWPLFECAPIAAVERSLSEQVEGARERARRPRLAGDHHVQLLGHGLTDLLEECAIQVLFAVEELLHGGAVEIENEVHPLGAQAIAGEHRQIDLPIAHFPHFSADLVAPLGVEARQKVLEGLI